MEPGSLPDKLILDIDPKDETVVKCDVAVAKILC